MQYNTQKVKLTMPEYGRNIHNMINHCVAIEDPEKRKICAYSVINVMGNMFPHLRDVNNFKHILWDHLAIMSDFKLDIEYPYEIIKREELYSAPGKIEYSRATMKYRHYGKILEKIIDIAAKMEEGDKKVQLVKMIASQMKKSYVQWNKNVDDEKIYEDLADLSGGKLKYSSEDYVIPEVKTAPSRDKLKNIRHQRRR
jgi:hypothetical protein